MKKTTVLMALLFLGLSAAVQAQDWYHDRDARYSGDRWRSHVFAEVGTDLDHIWSAKARGRQRTGTY